MLLHGQHTMLNFMASLEFQAHSPLVNPRNSLSKYQWAMLPEVRLLHQLNLLPYQQGQRGPNLSQVSYV